jgi:putative protease
MNWVTAEFWYNLGVKRIILSRELSLEEIQEINHRVSGMELEAFVHGSICIA